MIIPSSRLLSPLRGFSSHSPFRAGCSGLLSLLLCCFFLCPSLSEKYALAGENHEKPYALIFGTVWGPDNHPLYGMKIKVRRSDDKKWRWELFSDHNGEFAVRVPAGKADYLVWPDVKHYKSLNGDKLQPAEEVHVHVENEERVDTGVHLK